MIIEVLSIVYFIFFLTTNISFFKICDKVMDKTRFGKASLYLVSLTNAIVMTMIAYSFNQLPTVTYAMVLSCSLVQLCVLFKNNIYGICMYSFMATLYLICVESIVVSSGALLSGVTIPEVTHDHSLLFSHIVLSWFVCMMAGLLIYNFVPTKYLKILNENKEHTFFVLGFLLIAMAYLTVNSLIYGNADSFASSYLIVHQIAAPLAWLGVINLSVFMIFRFAHLHGYKVKEDMLLETIDRQRSELIESKSKAERDTLVSAYNRVTAEEKINSLLKQKAQGAFFIIDIDDFKNINDTKGHPFGDKVLINLTKRLSNTFREEDIIGRIGGDEFIVFLKAEPTTQMLNHKANALCKDISLPFANNGEVVKVSISIGISVAPLDGEDFASLYTKADKALYNSKNKGKNTFSFFE